MADSPGEAPAAFQARILVAPLAVLAIGAVVTHFVAEDAARSSQGGWINLSALGYAICWVAYAVCATAFVWIDSVFVRRLPARTWPSTGRMVAATVGAAALGIVAGLLGGGILGAVVAFVGSQDTPGSVGLFLVFLLGVPLALLVGLVANLRLRRTARIRR